MISQGQKGRASDFKDSSAGSADVGKVPKLNANGQLDNSFGLKFGGDGSDGELNISSGTTDIDVGGAKVFIKNYSSISITGTGKLTFSNPHANGTIIILRCTGDVTLTSSQAPMIDASGMGASGATGTTVVAGNRTWGNGQQGQSLGFLRCGANSGVTGGTALEMNSTLLSKANLLLYSQIFSRYHMAFVGGGGGNGSVTYNTGGGSCVVGNGGKGGGALIIECKGKWNFTTANGISVAGKNPDINNIVSGQYSVGGNGGGGGGFFLGLYNILTANSGTVNVAGGVGGVYHESFNDSLTGAGGGGGYNAGSDGTNQGTDGVKNGGDGGIGYSLIEKNIMFA